jgi:hypothetical protein
VDTILSPESSSVAQQGEVLFRPRQEEVGSWVTVKSALRKAGLEILHSNGHRTLIRAQHSRVYEALSGFHPDPEPRSLPGTESPGSVVHQIRRTPQMRRRGMLVTS